MSFAPRPPQSFFLSALLGGLLLAAPQAEAQFFFPFGQPQPQQQQQPARPARHHVQSHVRRRVAVQQQAPQPQQQQPFFWWDGPQQARPQPAQPRYVRAPQPEESLRDRQPGDGAVVDLASHDSFFGGGPGRQSGADAAVLPPDADPNYSTPVNLDPDVNYKYATRKEVADPTGEAAGTVTISTAKRKLYYSLGDGKAMEYGVAVGKAGFAWKGDATIGRKSYWPGWTPPPEMLERSPDLPDHVDGSLHNPLGARALYLFQGNKDTLFRIHGTNDPKSIGHAVSSGCIRMENADVIDLYGRVSKGTRVVVK